MSLTFLAFLALLASLASFVGAADLQPPTVNILFPEAESVVESSRPVIAFSIFDEESDVDMRATRVYLDGADISLFIRNAGDLVTYTATSDLADGVHRVAVVVADTKGNQAPPKLWAFTVKATTPPLLQLMGNAVTELWYADPIKFPLYESYLPYRTGFKGWTTQFTASASGQSMGNIVNLYSYVNSQSTADQQTLQRFRGQMTGPGFQWGMGDLFPMYTEFSFYGSQRLRGGEFGVTVNDDYPLKLKYHFFGGEAKQALEGGDNIGGTYRQTVWGARALLSFGEGWAINATYLRGKDEMGSIEVPSYTVPTENDVTNVEATMNFPFLASKLSGEIGFSRYNPNTATRPGDWDSGRAWKVKLATDLGDHSWSIAFRDIRPSFLSYGNPFLLLDQVGVEFSENSRLLNNQMFFSFSGSQYFDNLERGKSSTTKTQSANMNTSLIFPGLPSFNIGGGYQARETDEADPVTKNYTVSMNLGVNGNVSFGTGWSVSTFGSYLFLQYRDFGQIRANHFNSLSATVGWVWTLAQDWSMSEVFSFNQNHDLGTDLITKYFLGTVKFSYKMFGGVFTPFVGYNGLASLSTSETSNTRKDSVPLGFTYAPNATHNLSVSFEHIEYKDLRTEENGYIENVTIIRYTLNF